MKLFKLSAILLLGCCLAAFTTQKNRPVHIFMAGDSTMANKVLTKTVTDSITGEKHTELFPERGWGMVLPNFFTENIVIKNYAKNGRSTRTFIEEGLWDSINSGIRQGDFVVIQFGHNDASEKKVDRYTPPNDYKKNIEKFIDETRAKGGIPILCTPVARRKYKDGEIVNTHGVYTGIVAEIAKEKQVIFVDLFDYTKNWLDEVGEENSTRFFMHIPPGVNRIYPNGLIDNTHFVQKGAEKVAAFFVENIIKQQIKGLTENVKRSYLQEIESED